MWNLFFLCSVMTHIDIHIIIDGSHYLVGIMKVAWEIILSIFVKTTTTNTTTKTQQKQTNKQTNKQQQQQQQKKTTTYTVLASGVIQALMGLFFISFFFFFLDGMTTFIDFYMFIIKTQMIIKYFLSRFTWCLEACLEIIFCPEVCSQILIDLTCVQYIGYHYYYFVFSYICRNYYYYFIFQLHMPVIIMLPQCFLVS